ncbi:MAG: type IV secretion system DNA-binding domain-containing protein [Candidatus Cloacimonetes bacterium]|nr:type IV secretion system DNA-binding domain-containing protein [Candidatus Cloacimonadota bacterium]
MACAELIFEREYYYPIKTFPDFEVDPLSAITSSIEGLKEKEQVWTQILIRPIPDIWQEPGYSYIDEVRSGEKKEAIPLVKAIASGVFQHALSFFGYFIGSIISGPSEPAKVPPPREAPPPRLPPEKEDVLKSIQRKLALNGFETAIRIIGTGETADSATANSNSFIAALKQFSTAQLNSFVRAPASFEPEKIYQDYQARALPTARENLFILNTEELASVFHLPNVSVETPNIAWVHAKKSEPPIDLPTQTASKFARTAFRDREVSFGIKLDDRRRHMYVIGKTGTGKTTLLRNMIINDMRAGEGLAVVDPHGELFEHILDFIPDNRVDDVIIFDPSDVNFPVALNPLELFDPEQRPLVASGLIDVFRHRFEFSWGPRLEHLLRNTMLSLLEVPGTTLLGITRILTDRAYERYIVHLLRDPILKDFWNNEFKEMRGNQRLVTEAIAPIQNRIGPFLATPTIRNIVGNARSTIKLDEIMNQGKILLVNLAKGKIGEDNSGILGGMLVARLWFAAMLRASIPEEQRRDFYVYIDEFQNFATTSIATILSEARKYRLNLILAHQYIAQVPKEVTDAVFGNIGTMICFTLGQQDAHVLARELVPVFEEDDLINLEKFHIYLKLMIDLTQSRPFSAVTLPPILRETGNKEQVLSLGREKRSRPREQVEERIRRWSEKQFTPGMDDAEVEKARQELRTRAVASKEEPVIDKQVKELTGEIKL